MFPLSRSPVATIRSAVAAAPSLQLSPLLPVIVNVFVKSVIKVRRRRIRMKDRRGRSKWKRGRGGMIGGEGFGGKGRRMERSVMERESVKYTHTHTHTGTGSNRHAPSKYN